MLVGLTGGIGSGKSTIARELAKRGFAVYDCDREAKRIIVENESVRNAIIALLGEETFVNGHYNTAYVAKRVFENPELLAQLNSIVHPAVKEDILRNYELKIKNYESSTPFFIESAILFEAHLDAICDKIVIVDAPEEIRIARVIGRDYKGDASEENIHKVRARIRAQKSPAGTEMRQGVPMLTVLNDGPSVLRSIVDRICDFAAH